MNDCLEHIIQSIDHLPPFPLLDVVLRAYLDESTAGLVGPEDATPTADVRAGREVRTGDVLHEFLDGDVGILDERSKTATDLAHVMRRNAGRHPANLSLQR